MDKNKYDVTTSKMTFVTFWPGSLGLSDFLLNIGMSIMKVPVPPTTYFDILKLLTITFDIGCRRREIHGGFR